MKKNNYIFFSEKYSVIEERTNDYSQKMQLRIQNFQKSDVGVIIFEFIIKGMLIFGISMLLEDGMFLLLFYYYYPIFFKSNVSTPARFWA